MLRFTLGVLLLAVGVALAEDKKDEKKDAPKLSGNWVREADGHVIKFTFEEKTLKIAVNVGDRVSNRTPGFDEMGAIRKSATIQQRPKFREALAKPSDVDSPKPHLAQPWGVGNEAAARQRMHHGANRGVASLVHTLTDLGGTQIEPREERVHER